MTQLSDLEISKALALAIGWPDVFFSEGKCVVDTEDKAITLKLRGYWMIGLRIFDYRDWAVIGPIAEKFDCFPTQGVWGEWHSSYHQCAGSVQAVTPQKAIAMAVIGAKK